MDGDVFQPMWYNWIYDYPAVHLSAEETHNFYRDKIRKGLLRFPDLYIVFQVEEKELRRRKDADKTRRRRNFEKHLQLIQPQLQYFKFLQQHTDLAVEFMDYDDLNKTKRGVSLLIKQTNSKEKNDLQIFEKLCEWLDKNPI